MLNRISEYRLSTMRLTPTEAEVWASVRPEQLTSSTQVRGRLAGPRCHYSSTVEVAYPWREHSRQYATEGPPNLVLRTLIPEPSLWDPTSPFLYGGSLELWQGGQQCDRAEITHGLRDFVLTPNGLRWNGRPLLLQGARREQLLDADAPPLRNRGVNLLLAPARNMPQVCRAADRLGFLVLGRIGDRSGYHAALLVQHHPCCLGWVLEQHLLEDPLFRAIDFALPDDALANKQLIGMTLDSAPAQPLPSRFHFVFCAEDRVQRLAGVQLPKLVQRAGSAPMVLPPGDLGWVAD